MKKTVVYILVALVFVIGIGGIFSIKAESKKRLISENYRVEEKEYVSEIKEVLVKYYVPNAGVMLTKTSEDGINLDYKVEIHTGYKLDGEMESEIKGLALKVPNSSVRVVISGED